MREIDRYAIEPLAGSGCSRLLDTQTASVVPQVHGTVLEAQYELADGYKLLWLTEDSPYDEALHVHLLDGQGRVDDSLSAGVVFAAGILDIHEVGERSVDFGFFRNDVTYRIGVESVSRLRMRLPVGWRYRHVLRKHRLTVTQKEV